MSKKFETLLEATLLRYQGTPFLPGDLLKFRKGWQKDPWFRTNPDYVQKIQSWIDSGKNIRMSITKSVFGQPTNEVSQVADITLESAPGLYSDFITIPINLIERIDTGNNLAPIPDNQKRKNGTQIKPSRVKKEKDSQTRKIGKQETGTELPEKNTKIPHGNKWNDKKPGGRKNDWAKVKESTNLMKSEGDLIFEAYRDNVLMNENEGFGNDEAEAFDKYQQGQDPMGPLSRYE